MFRSTAAYQFFFEKLKDKKHKFAILETDENDFSVQSYEGSLEDLVLHLKNIPMPLTGFGC
ncbi:MAG TPA: hypothetical protein PKN48_01005 [Bacteroidales bacterium]|nr:hypothetical protein [Bacteroidales bacterium]